MKRKSPYRHPVSRYTRRDGKTVDKYMRGEGDAPRQPMRIPRGSSSWSVSFVPTDETYNAIGSPVAALRSAIGKIQKPVIPTKVTLRRVRS